MGKNGIGETRKFEILENYYQVLIREGFEGASIGKIAKRMDIHPSLIMHYFKTKDNMTDQLVDLLITKYESPDFLQFDHITDPTERFYALIDTLFSKEWSRTIDPGVHFGFYYLSFRRNEIKNNFRKMFKSFRDYLVAELTICRKEKIIDVDDVGKAADMIVVLMEGLEFQAAFLSEEEEFDAFAHYSSSLVYKMLKAVPR